MREGTTMTDFWRDLVLTAIHNMSVTLGTVLPSILAMLTLVALGALLGWIAGTVVARLAQALALDQRSRTWGITAALARAGIYRPPSQVLRLVAFWGIFVIFATMGIDALAIPGAPGATSMLMRFLPRLLSALLILVVGWLAANFLGQAMLITAVNAGILQARLLARTTRWVILLFAVATALVEIGIGRDMVLIAFGVLFGGLVLALALAFGLGGRHLAREILERGRRREREPAPQDSITHL
jgi:Mechanosensitive ion channel, conserved TM helix